MRILLFGRHGKLGRALQRTLAPMGELTVLGSAEADFRHPEALAALLRAAAPQVVVNAAAYNAVDRAESEAALAQAVNADAPGLLAREAAALGAWFVHYGSDYVFDGAGDAPWTEDALARPLSVYGRSKLDGEQRVRSAGGAHLVFRTSWLHAPHAECFSRSVLRQAAERERLEVVDDQVGAPTSAALVAEVTAAALRAALARPALSGLYHLAAAGHTSRHGWAAFVIDWARREGLPLRVRELAAVPSAQRPSAARRPLNSRLDTRRLQAVFGVSLPSWQDGVLQTLRADRPQERVR